MNPSLWKRAAWTLMLCAGQLGGCAREHDLGESVRAVMASPDAGQLTSSIEAVTSLPEPDPFGLAGKRTAELNQLIAEENAAGEPFHNRSAGKQARLEALYRARSKRLGKRPIEERLVFTAETEMGGPAPEEPRPPNELLPEGGTP